jgi:hypothetical protein
MMNPPQHIPFNGDRLVGRELAKLIARFGVLHAIETGMWSAHTTRELRRMVKGQVLSFDPDQSNLIKEFGPDAVGDLLRLGIQPVMADSSRQLGWGIRQCHEHDLVHEPRERLTPILFYLDAHGGGINGTSTNPLREELEQIAQNTWCQNNCVIFIHDFMVPGKEWGYTWGDWGRGAEPLSYSVLEYFGVLPRLFPGGWDYHYNEKAEGVQRGMLYLYPKVKP